MAVGGSRSGGRKTVRIADEAPPGTPNDARPDGTAEPVARVGDDDRAPVDDGAPADGSTTPAGDEPTDGEAVVADGSREPSRGGRRRALLVSLLAWLLPGFGHLVLGQWLRGLAFSSLVATSAAVGVALHGRLYWFGYGFSAAPIDPLPNVESPVLVVAASLVSLGLGLPAIALRWLAGYQGDVTAPGYEYGTAFLLTAGLMNALLVLDVWDEAR